MSSVLLPFYSQAGFFFFEMGRKLQYFSPTVEAFAGAGIHIPVAPHESKFLVEEERSPKKKKATQNAGPSKKN